MNNDKQFQSSRWASKHGPIRGFIRSIPLALTLWAVIIGSLLLAVRLAGGAR